MPTSNVAVAASPGFVDPPDARPLADVPAVHVHRHVEPDRLVGDARQGHRHVAIRGTPRRREHHRMRLRRRRQRRVDRHPGEFHVASRNLNGRRAKPRAVQEVLQCLLARPDQPRHVIDFFRPLVQLLGQEIGEHRLLPPDERSSLLQVELPREPAVQRRELLGGGMFPRP